MYLREDIYKRCNCPDGILGHQFNKRLESFAPCSSKSLLLTDFKENYTLLQISKFLQKIQKKETRVYS
jgi:hypothetical protein